MYDKEFILEQTSKELIADQPSKELLTTSKEILRKERRQSEKSFSSQTSVTSSERSSSYGSQSFSSHANSSRSYSKPEYIHTASGDIPYDEWLKRREIEKVINVDLPQKRKEAEAWRIEEWKRAVSTPAGNPSARQELIRLRKKIDDWIVVVDKYIQVLENWEGEKTSKYKQDLEAWRDDLEWWKIQLGTNW